jgi:UPF0755 protein
MPDEQPTTPLTTTPAPQPINGQPSGLQAPKKLSKRRKFTYIVGGIIVLIIIMVATALITYAVELSPRTKNTGQLIKVTIETGSTPSDIGHELQNDKVIRSATAFEIYAKFSGNDGKLQAGTYRLSPSDSTHQIIDHLVKGSVDTFSITFLPGATVVQDREVLISAGFGTTEIDAALAKTYTSPLFDTKPASSDLEGYIYGQTYDFNDGATVASILQRTFDEFETVVQKYNLVSEFQKQGLTLYQGITLSSIVQREVNAPKGDTPSSDQQQVAQVFYLRLADNIPLGSDVTFMYAAQKYNIPSTPTTPSPYNTRINTGLPPGPIAVPGLTALEATADPATTDYEYFLAGDNGTIYFAHTEAEHEANIVNYCKQNCN